MRCNLLLAHTVVLALLALATTISAEQRTTKEYLEEANRLLLQGDLQEAMKNYDTAIAKDPQNYLTYFNRATTLLSLSKHASAVRDFSRAIELKPDFEQAYFYRARIYLKEGNYSGAEDDLGMIAKSGSKDLAKKSSELKHKVSAAREMSKKAEQALLEKKYSECSSAATKAIRASPLSAAALKTRALCRIAEGDVEGASADLGRLVRIRSDDLETLNMLADLHFLALNEPDRGMENVRACLKSDPDNKRCKATYMRLRGVQRKIAKVESDRSKRKWNACNRAVAPLNGKDGLLAEVDSMYAEFIVAAEIPAGIPSRLATQLAGIACEGFANTKKWEKALSYCARVLDADPDNADALGNQFDAQLETDRLDHAQATLAKLESIAAGGSGMDMGQQKMHERRAKLENLRRLAARKDYYKILDVAKDATSAEIKKAYRKLAHQWHPDRYRGDLPKEEVEKKMADINLAYEVLMDDEKRASYDRGFDPNDPSSGAGPAGPGGFNGFGGHPFMFRQGAAGGKPVFFQQQGSGGQQFSFQFGGPGGFPF
ncbi:hypothetical protein J3B02_001389 [Coemansia erecta]|uniref:J domain-containing protein n=1 Tax=Coemansia asiatica TaxID=1052880 RepID=A0A9W8CLL2_9FUNG|nr:hypothetical protein LPJ64_001771 [Coemansia asiatica]KAJ2856817.1 hypothetical protein J3B02_001389 [Coemansia erecta]KAJ2877699.1 hypothetical protein FB639_003649 [Coemansia asiatica]